MLYIAITSFKNTNSSSFGIVPFDDQDDAISFMLEKKRENSDFVVSSEITFTNGKPFVKSIVCIFEDETQLSIHLKECIPGNELFICHT